MLSFDTVWVKTAHVVCDQLRVAPVQSKAKNAAHSRIPLFRRKTIKGRLHGYGSQHTMQPLCDCANQDMGPQ